MSTRLDPDKQTALAPPGVALAGNPGAVAPIAFDPDDQYGGPALPSDHPAWMKDALSLSQRARALVAKLKPIVLHVVMYWEHRVHTIVAGGRRIRVDPSGSYRMD